MFGKYGLLRPAGRRVLLQQSSPPLGESQLLPESELQSQRLRVGHHDIDKGDRDSCGISRKALPEGLPQRPEPAAFFCKVDRLIEQRRLA